MSRLGERLIRSAEEALAIAQGKVEPARVIAAEEIDVAAIRKRMKLSQGKFAERFRLSTATVRDWEQKRRNPDRIALNLLRVIEEFPDVVARALARDVEAKTVRRSPERRVTKRAARRTHTLSEAR
jgi:putative transcriptional regulator